MTDESNPLQQAPIDDGPRHVRMPRWPLHGWLPGSHLAVIHPGIQVVPGETLTDLRLRVQGRTLGISRDLEPMYRDIWVWYCPYRLAWDGWVDWLASHGATGTLPTIKGARPWLGEGSLKATDSIRNGLLRRAYYTVADHQLYRPPSWRDEFPPYSADNFDGSTLSKTLRQLPSPEILADCEHFGDEDDALAHVTLPVTWSTEGDDSTATVQVSMEDLRLLAQKQAEAEHVLEGNMGLLSPYEQMLALYGVPMEAGTDLGEDPELLHHSRTLTWPTRFTEPSDGSIQARYDIAMDVRSEKRHYFREHGVVMVLCGLRWLTRVGNKGGLLTYQRTRPQDFVPPFSTYSPMLETEARGASNVDLRKEWLFHEPGDSIDSREEMYRGEFLGVGPTPVKAGDVKAGQLWETKFADRSASRSKLALAQNPAFSSNSDWATGAVAQMSGLVTASIRTHIPRPAVDPPAVA